MKRRGEQTVIMFSYKFVCSLALLLVIVEVCDACSCWMPHPQTTSCNQEVVMEAMVKSVTKDEKRFRNTYTIDVVRTYRTVKGASEVTKFHSASTDGLCGMHFELNTKYLLQGYFVDNELTVLYVNLCSGSKRWDRLSRTEVNVFENGGYECGCKVETCWDFEECHVKRKDMCKTMFLKSARGCACAIKEDGNCGWKSDDKESMTCSGVPIPPPIPTRPPPTTEAPSPSPEAQTPEQKQTEQPLPSR